MKTFRMIGMALVAVLMCVNFAGCSKDDEGADQGADDVGGGTAVVTKEKKLTKIVGTSGSDTVTYEFSYDDKGRVTKASGVQNYDGEYEKETVQFIWGDDAIMVDYKRSSSYSSENESYSAKLTLQNGLVQNSDIDEKFTYNGSGRISSRVVQDYYETTSVLWDGNKLVSISDKDGKAALAYGSSSCKKGYFPFFPIMIGFDFELLYIANPELIGAKTTQLPTSYKYYSNHSEEEDLTTLAYDLDGEGYISKVTIKQEDVTVTYVLTWK